LTDESNNIMLLFNTSELLELGCSEH